MRWTVYVDMDAYYVSCELRERPELLGRPVIVGPDPKLGPTRGVVLSASYEARAFGVRSALPVGQADRLCPDAVWIPADFPKYEATAREVRELLATVGTRMVPLSIDEAAVEVEAATAEVAEAFARAVQQSIRVQLRLPSSVGVSPHRTVAKIASDRAKPGGVVVVAPEATASFLAPLSVRTVPGVGPKTAERLKAIGIERIGELLLAPPTTLRAAVGSFSVELLELARGTPRESEWSSGGPRSRSSAETFVTDVGALPELLLAVDRLADALGGALTTEQLAYQTVTIGVRWDDFQRVQRSQTLGTSHLGPATLRSAGRRLVSEIWHGEPAKDRRKVRTLSLSAERLRSVRAAGRTLDAFPA